MKKLCAAGAEARGAVFTRREVVDFILDLVGYMPDRRLCGLSLLESSFGHGDFLLVVVERVLEAWSPCQPPTRSTRRSCNAEHPSSWGGHNHQSVDHWACRPRQSPLVEGR